MEAMGGAIAVESGGEAGATFHVHLPLPSADDAAERPFAIPELTNENVLIVAPGPLEASLIARRLAGWGARTKIVPDEKVAATLLPEQLWTSVLIDHALGSAGLRGVRARCRRNPATAGFGHAGDAQRARRPQRRGL